MAELIAAGTALGVVSSLVTFADVAWRVLKRLEEYSDKTKDVPEVIKNMRPLLLVLAEKLEELKGGERDASLATNSPSSLSRVLKPFEEQIILLDQLTSKMLPAESDSRRLRVKKAALSIYYEKELLRVWAQIETYQTTLILHFTNTASFSVPILGAKPVKNHYHYPASVAGHLVTREMLLRKIDDVFSSPNLASGSQTAVLLGMGGCGKTQLALQYCQQSEANRLFSCIFWVDASSPASVTQSLSSIAAIITDNKTDPKDFEHNLQIVKGSLSTWTSRWLIVFDNFDDPNLFENRDIRAYFPHGDNGAILFTSRHGDVKRLGQTIAINEMSENEGLELLFRQVGYDKNESNRAVAKDIIAWLGYLALAIDQAGAYISVRRLPLHLFLDHYDKRREKVFKETPGTFWEYRRKLNDAEAETSLNVFTTWEMSFEQINRDQVNGKTQEHLLTLSAFFNNTDIFEELFQARYKYRRSKWIEAFIRDGAWDSFEFQDTLAQLAKLSLISSLEITATGAHFSLHPLVQDWIKLRSSIQDQQKMTIEAMSILSDYIETNDIGGLTFSWKQLILLHLTASLQNEASFIKGNMKNKNESLLRAVYNSGLLYEELGRLGEAKTMYNRALEGIEKVFGRDHMKALQTVNNLGSILCEQGQFVKAEAMCNRALEGIEKVFGRDHIETLRTVNSLGIILCEQGQFVKAEAMLKRALEGREKALGQDHIRTLDTVCNLGLLYRRQGQSEAEAFFIRALKVQEKVLGQDHRTTLLTLIHLGHYYCSQSRPEAEALYLRALQGEERTLGASHPLTFQTMRYLGQFYHKQSRYAEAESFYNRALEGQEKVLGDHIDTLKTIHNLACLYEEQSRHTEAEAFYTRALEGEERTLGESHVLTLLTINNLVVLYNKQGRQDEAKAMFARLPEDYCVRPGVINSKYIDSVVKVSKDNHHSPPDSE